ncbi:golgi apyrase [[Candida] railenensis]|uniref:Golgi apyrase n=1 Tax=[Candida] railenensis TaxID=45579 RepID=A0A9P0QP94_9ASCO|nr:golgi apyrase [[Candida] railenensis]
MGKKITGPVKSKEGVPYDYIVLVDSGSKGSRVYVYNWLNAKFLLDKGLSYPRNLNLVKRFELRDDDPDSDSSDDDENTDQEDNDSKSAPFLPPVLSNKDWHKKIKPGVSTFNESPQKIGKHHIKHLLSLANSVVPKSQHYRTPFFLHSTAGMRLLSPKEQQQILDNICEYVQRKSEFYLPDCASHINVIDGDIEGLFGWLSVNNMVGSFDHPDKHQHGKNHTTYGLLDMGGASTQVVFQPNSTEIEEHQNNLFEISLNQATGNIGNADSDLINPMKFNVYSDSFLGFGMYQAHNKYLSYVIDEYLANIGQSKIADPNNPYDSIREPIVDPCLPKGYLATASHNDFNIAFTGESDFAKCLNSIFPVISNSTYSISKGTETGKCKQLETEDEVGACLLNDLIPAFDFEVNHFIGVSGYWDSIRNLLAFDEEDEKLEPVGIDNYDYKTIYNETNRICSSSLAELIALNSVKSKENQMPEDDLSELCFKSSWVLNFLHLGLGFPRYGIDHESQKEFKSLQLIEEVDGFSFSWTFGRAQLYANDEFSQAYNNYTSALNAKEKDKSKHKPLVDRAGFFHTTSTNDFHYGGEQKGIIPRPYFHDNTDNSDSPNSDYAESNGDVSESAWYIHPHRWYGLFIFMLLIAFFGVMLLGRDGRKRIIQNLKSKLGNGNGSRYVSIRGEDDPDLENGVDEFELGNIPARDDFSKFQIDDEEESI